MNENEKELRRAILKKILTYGKMTTEQGISDFIENLDNETKKIAKQREGEKNNPIKQTMTTANFD